MMMPNCRFNQELLGVPKEVCKTSIKTTHKRSVKVWLIQSLTEYVFLQLLKRLQKSIATLETCGEWGKKAGGEDRKTFQRDSTLELETKRVWAQARAPQKQLFDLKASCQTTNSINLSSLEFRSADLLADSSCKGQQLCKRKPSEF